MKKILFILLLFCVGCTEKITEIVYVEPEVTLPEIVLPDIIIPEIVVPEIVIPETVIPEIVVPEIVIPEIVIPPTVVDVVFPEPVIEPAPVVEPEPVIEPVVVIPPIDAVPDLLSDYNYTISEMNTPNSSWSYRWRDHYFSISGYGFIYTYTSIHTEAERDEIARARNLLSGCLDESFSGHLHCYDPEPEIITYGGLQSYDDYELTSLESFIYVDDDYYRTITSVERLSDIHRILTLNVCRQMYGNDCNAISSEFVELTYLIDGIAPDYRPLTVNQLDAIYDYAIVLVDEYNTANNIQ